MPKADIAMISPLLLITGLLVCKSKYVLLYFLSSFIHSFIPCGFCFGFLFLKLPALTSKSVTSTPLDLVVIAIPLKLVTSAGIWLAAQWTIDAYANGHSPLFHFIFLLYGFKYYRYTFCFYYLTYICRLRTWILVLPSVSVSDAAERNSGHFDFHFTDVFLLQSIRSHNRW